MYILLRVEQLYPYPEKALENELSRFPNARVVWCQEEPRNMGSWTYIREPLEDHLRNMGHSEIVVRYAGRDAAAATCYGSCELNMAAQQAALVDDALTVHSRGAKTSARAVKSSAKPAAKKATAKKAVAKKTTTKKSASKESGS